MSSIHLLVISKLVCERVFRSTVDTLLHNNQLPMTHLVSQIITSLPTMSITRSTIDSDDKTTVSDSASTSSQDGVNSTPNSTTNTDETMESGQKVPPDQGTDDQTMQDSTDYQFGFDWYDPVVSAYKATHPRTHLVSHSFHDSHFAPYFLCAILIFLQFFKDKSFFAEQTN